MVEVRTVEPRPRHWIILYAVAFFALSSEGAMGLVFPLLLIARETSAQEIGTLVALAALGPLILSIPAGQLCDRYGDRAVLLACAAGALVTMLLYPAVTGFWLLAAVQILGGTARSLSWLATQSWATRHSRAADRAHHMGFLTFAANLGMLLTPLAAGMVMDRHGVETGFYLLAVWSLLLLLLLCVLPAFPVVEPAPSRQGSVLASVVDPFRDAWRMTLRPVVAVVLLGTFLRLGTIALAQSFYPVFLTQAGYSAATIGSLFSLMFLASTVASPLYGWAIRFVPGGGMIWLSAALSVAGICLIPLSNSLISVALLTVVHGIGIGFSLPTLLAEMAGRTGAQERGMAVAVRSVFNRLGYLTVPVMIGWSVAAVGLAPSFYLAGGVMGAKLLAGMVLDWRVRPVVTR
ncbi:MAG: MFS transporter [Pseudomonadota bacterium]|nr:MFS transporter [Pseudomonadota bacterium]